MARAGVSLFSCFVHWPHNIVGSRCSSSSIIKSIATILPCPVSPQPTSRPYPRTKTPARARRDKPRPSAAPNLPSRAIRRDNNQRQRRARSAPRTPNPKPPPTPKKAKNPTAHVQVVRHRRPTSTLEARSHRTARAYLPFPTASPAHHVTTSLFPPFRSRVHSTKPTCMACGRRAHKLPSFHASADPTARKEHAARRLAG